MQTGNQVTGRPCLGAWASYGLGSLNENLPTFVVLVAKPTQHRAGAGDLGPALVERATCPASTPASRSAAAGDPILYINNPPGVSTEVRRKTLDGLKALNEMNYQADRRSRDADAHPAVRDGLPHAGQRAGADRPGERAGSTFELYGDAAKKPGTFANTVLLARRLVERGVRFVQIYHNNWDTHANVAGRLPDQCRDVDQACYGLIQDLKQRGLFDETLVIWGGEFGRTIYSQGGLTKQNYGRDHHPRCFTMWMAGGGSKPAARSTARPTTSRYNIVKDPVHVRDFHATVLHLLGFDHARFTVRYQGLDQKLTGVEQARVVRELIG